MILDGLWLAVTYSVKKTVQIDTDVSKVYMNVKVLELCWYWVERERERVVVDERWMHVPRVNRWSGFSQLPLFSISLKPAQSRRFPCSIFRIRPLYSNFCHLFFRLQLLLVFYSLFFLHADSHESTLYLCIQVSVNLLSVLSSWSYNYFDFLFTRQSTNLYESINYFFIFYTM